MADPAVEGCANVMPREGDDDDDDNGEGGGDGDGDEAASPPLRIAVMSGRFGSSGKGEVNGRRTREGTAAGQPSGWRPG